MHVGHKPPIPLAQAPLQQAKKPRADSKESPDVMYDPLRIAEDLGDGGKRGRSIRAAPQRNSRKRPEDAAPFQDAAEQSASAQKAALELSNLLGAVNPQIAPPSNADRTESAAASEPSLDDLLNKVMQSG